MDSENKRRHERKDYNQEVHLQFDNKTYVVMIENISLSGAYIGTTFGSAGDIGPELGFYLMK